MIISVSAITKELVLACRQLGLVVTETLAAFVAVTILNPSTGTFYVAKPLEEADARAVVEAAVKKLFAKKVQPDLQLLKLQASYSSAAHDTETSFAKKDADREEQTKRLLAGIKSEEPVKFEKQDFDAISVTYRQIFAWLLLKCGHPDPDAEAKIDKAERKAVERECAAALESVFPRVGLRAFVSLTPNEKAAQLQELAAIVLGIRLFNAHLGKGGTCLPLDAVDTRSLQEADELLRVLQVDLDHDAAECEKLAAFLLYAAKAKAKPAATRTTEAMLELLYRRQLLTYLLSLQDEVAQSQERLAAAVQQYAEELDALDALVGSKTSVPKEQVYPRFDGLARTFRMCWNDSQRLRRCQELQQLLKKHREEYCPGLPAAELDSLAAWKVEHTEADVGLADSSDVPATPANECEIIPPDDEAFMQLGVDLQCLCPYMLTENKGLLVPGNPQLGVVKYKQFALCFSTKTAMAAFIEDPAKMMNNTHALPNENPGLIELLHLDDAFPQSSLKGILRGTAGFKLSSTSMQADAACATPVHFVEENFDPDYEWNEWKLRQQALSLADIRKKATAATQTKLSALRRDTETQVYLPKEKATSTGVSQGTNPPQWKRYITGLRGEDREVKVVDLKFEL
jgi:hypothetical protein